jgi:hypothetical protein
VKLLIRTFLPPYFSLSFHCQLVPRIRATRVTSSQGMESGKAGAVHFAYFVELVPGLAIA